MNESKGLYIDAERLYKKIERLKDEGRKNILIHAPVETGKSALIKNKLLKESKDKKIAILSNRTLLKEQTKKDIGNKDNVKIYCYQIIGLVLDESEESKKRKRNFKNRLRLESDLFDTEIDEYFEQTETFVREDVKDIDYLVLDEAHYFTTDSTFNESTFKEFDYIYKNTKGVKLFLTATPNALTKAIQEYEKEHEIESNHQLTIIKELEQLTATELLNLEGSNTAIPEYKMDLVEHFSDRYIFEFVHDRDKEKRIIEEVQKSNPNNKLIYFSNNKLYGLTISKLAEGKKLINKDYHGGTFLCSLFDTDGFIDYINMTERNRIIEQERFFADVLVTTKVLDNGINIRDDKVKRVIIEYTTYDEVIQMIGRIRTKQRKSDKPLKIILIIPNIKKLKRYIMTAEDKLGIKENSEVKVKNIFEKAQREYELESYHDLLKISKTENIDDGYKSFMYDYFGKLYSNLTQGDLSLHASEVLGLEQLHDMFERDREEIEQEEYAKEQKKLRDDKLKMMKLQNNIHYCYKKHGNKEMLKDEFKQLAKELKFKNQDGSVSSTPNTLNEALEHYGYKIESKRKIVNDSKVSVYHFIKI